MGKATVNTTIYHYDNDARTYTRTVYSGCFWDDDLAANVAKTGLLNADSLYVSIPLNNAPELNINKGKDLIIKGDIDTDIDNSSQSLQAAAVKALKAAYEVFTITSVTLKNHGSGRLHHWELGGK